VLFSMHRHAGKYKITQNKIQGNSHFKTASPTEVENLMNQYSQDISQIHSKEDCLEKLGYIHNQLQYIHPFADGNSRTTRMVLNWMCMKHSIPIINIKMGCFDEYMNLTKLSKTRNDLELTYLFWRLLLHESF
jgi:Fic family protein